jgi:hypothetical protein
MESSDPALGFVLLALTTDMPEAKISVFDERL